MVQEGKMNHNFKLLATAELRRHIVSYFYQRFPPLLEVGMMLYSLNDKDINSDDFT